MKAKKANKRTYTVFSLWELTQDKHCNLKGLYHDLKSAQQARDTYAKAVSEDQCPMYDEWRLVGGTEYVINLEEVH